jgi:hypothetical protein
MSWPKGQPRPPQAGRKKGTPNRKTHEAQELAKKLGIDPFEILLHFAAGNWEKLGYTSPRRIVSAGMGVTIEIDQISPEMRVKAALEASKYVRPVLKAIEWKGDPAKVEQTLIYVAQWGNKEEPSDGADADLKALQSS